MKLTLLDWFAILAYLAASMIIGIYFRRKSSGSTEDYFVSGRDVSWWLAGTSMVATTFAADTPLAVTGIVYFSGIAGNWLWWSFLPSGMMTVFLFARLWGGSGPAQWCAVFCPGNRHDSKPKTPMFYSCASRMNEGAVSWRKYSQFC